MPLPTCGTIAGLPLTQQVAAIYCALYEGAGSPFDLPSCECVAGLPLSGMLSAIYCILVFDSESEDLELCECVSGNPINSALDSIYCAAFIQAGSPEDLDSCDCVKWKPLNQKVDAIYCVFYLQASDPTQLPDCDCIRGLPLQYKLDWIYRAILDISPIPTGEATLFIEWDDMSLLEDGFRIEISDDGVAYSTAGTVPANVEEYLITGLQYNTLYYVRVIAFNQYGDSAPDGPIEVYTATEFGPTNLQATTIDDQSVLVNYLDSITQPINGGYKVRYKKTSDPTYDENDFILLAVGEQEGSVSGLDGGTSYDFKAVTYNDNSANVPPQVDSESVPSNTASATTDTPVVTPTMVSAVSNTAGTQVTLTASEAVHFGAGGNGGFASTGRTWTYVSGFTSTTTAVYGVSPAIAFGDVVTVDYTQPGNGIENAANTDMASFTGLAVTNNVPDPGTSPGTGSMIAAYDFDNAGGNGTRNSANVGTHTLSANNAPTYGTTDSSTYGISTDGVPGAYWSTTTLDDSFGNVAGNWSIAIRFQAKTGTVSGDMNFSGNGSRWRVEYNSGGIRARIANIDLTSVVVPALDTWYSVVLTWDGTTARMYINGTLATSSASAGSFATGTYFLGASSSANSNPMWTDYLYAWNKTLSAPNAVWMYNFGATRVFSEL